MQESINATSISRNWNMVAMWAGCKLSVQVPFNWESMTFDLKPHMATFDMNDKCLFHVRRGRVQIEDETHWNKQDPDPYRLLSNLRERGRYAYGSGLPFFLISPFAFLAWYSAPVATEVPWQCPDARFVGRWIPEPPTETKHKTSEQNEYGTLLQWRKHTDNESQKFLCLSF
jgi:hypothetical protein